MRSNKLKYPCLFVFVTIVTADHALTDDDDARDAGGIPFFFFFFLLFLPLAHQLSLTADMSRVTCKMHECVERAMRSVRSVLFTTTASADNVSSGRAVPGPGGRPRGETCVLV